MQITGRVTADAKVYNVKGDKQVVNFTLAENHGYKNKEGKWVDLTEFYRCAYWFNAKIAKSLKKGRLVELTGRPSASAYTGQDGEARASLNFHTVNIKFHDGLNGDKPASNQDTDVPEQDPTDDLPF